MCTEKVRFRDLLIKVKVTCFISVKIKHTCHKQWILQAYSESPPVISTTVLIKVTKNHSEYIAEDQTTK